MKSFDLGLGGAKRQLGNDLLIFRNFRDLGYVALHCISSDIYFLRRLKHRYLSNKLSF